MPRPLTTAATAARGTARRFPLALIALGVLLYSTGPVMVQASSVSGPVFSFWRLWMGTGLLWVIVRLRGGGGGELLRSGPARTVTAVAGASFGIHQLLMFTAVKLTTVVDVALLNALAPVATAVGAWWLFGERPGRSFVGWSAIAIGGGAYLAVGASTGPAGDPLGMALAAFNVVFFTGFFLASKESRAHLPTVTFLAGVMTVAAVVVSAWVLLAGEAPGAATRTDLLLALAVAAGPGALGHVVMTWPLRWVPANVPPVMRLAQPAVAGVLAYLLLGEPLRWAHLIGGAVVVAGAAGAILSRSGRALRAEAASEGG